MQKKPKPGNRVADVQVDNPLGEAGSQRGLTRSLVAFGVRRGEPGGSRTCRVHRSEKRSSPTSPPIARVESPLWRVPKLP